MGQYLVVGKFRPSWAEGSFSTDCLFFFCRFCPVFFFFSLSFFFPHTALAAVSG